jgi:hypothetical protein
MLTLIPHSRIFLPWRWRRYVPPKHRFTKYTRRHIPEDGVLHSRRRENLKSYIDNILGTDQCIPVVKILHWIVSDVFVVVFTFSAPNQWSDPGWVRSVLRNEQCMISKHVYQFIMEKDLDLRNMTEDWELCIQAPVAYKFSKSMIWTWLGQICSEKRTVHD